MPRRVGQALVRWEDALADAVESIKAGGALHPPARPAEARHRCGQGAHAPRAGAAADLCVAEPQAPDRVDVVCGDPYGSATDDDRPTPGGRPVAGDHRSALGVDTRQELV
jgi:hypothetical protein